jgi:hypothetical protein
MGMVPFMLSAGLLSNVIPAKAEMTNKRLPARAAAPPLQSNPETSKKQIGGCK